MYIQDIISRKSAARLVFRFELGCLVKAERGCRYPEPYGPYWEQVFESVGPYEVADGQRIH